MELVGGPVKMFWKKLKIVQNLLRWKERIQVDSSCHQALGKKIAS